MMSKRKALALGLLEFFALYAIILVLGGFLLALQVDDFRGVSGSAAVILAYGGLALQAMVLAVGHVLLIMEYQGGRAPAWLVAFTYSKIAQSVAYVGVDLFVIAELFGIELPYDGRVTFALVACAAVGGMLAASVFVLSYLTVGFRYMIRPWPWQMVGDLRRGARSTRKTR